MQRYNDLPKVTSVANGLEPRALESLTPQAWLSWKCRSGFQDRPQDTRDMGGDISFRESPYRASPGATSF